jgi:hypothetical protein
MSGTPFVAEQFVHGWPFIYHRKIGRMRELTASQPRLVGFIESIQSKYQVASV